MGDGGGNVLRRAPSAAAARRSLSERDCLELGREWKRHLVPVDLSLDRRCCGFDLGHHLGHRLRGTPGSSFTSSHPRGTTAAVGTREGDPDLGGEVVLEEAPWVADAPSSSPRAAVSHRGRRALREPRVVAGPVVRTIGLMPIEGDVALGATPDPGVALVRQLEDPVQCVAGLDASRNGSGGGVTRPVHGGRRGPRDTGDPGRAAVSRLRGCSSSRRRSRRHVERLGRGRNGTCNAARWRTRAISRSSSTRLRRVKVGDVALHDVPPGSTSSPRTSSRRWRAVTEIEADDADAFVEHAARDPGAEAAEHAGDEDSLSHAVCPGTGSRSAGAPLEQVGGEHDGVRQRADLGNVDLDHVTRQQA